MDFKKVRRVRRYILSKVEKEKTSISMSINYNFDLFMYGLIVVGFIVFITGAYLFLVAKIRSA